MVPENVLTLRRAVIVMFKKNQPFVFSAHFHSVVYGVTCFCSIPPPSGFFGFWEHVGAAFCVHFVPLQYESTTLGTSRQQSWNSQDCPIVIFSHFFSESKSRWFWSLSPDHRSPASIFTIWWTLMRMGPADHAVAWKKSSAVVLVMSERESNFFLDFSIGGLCWWVPWVPGFLQYIKWELPCLWCSRGVLSVLFMRNLLRSRRKFSTNWGFFQLKDAF